MADPTYGNITLTALDPPGATLTFGTDPDVIEEQWDPRKSEPIEGLGGSSTTFDFGQRAIDAVRSLTWGQDGQFLTAAEVRQLREWLGTPGSTYRFEDAEGNDWTVELLTGFRPKAIFGRVGEYHATLRVHALEMAAYLGEPYLGD